MRTLVLSADDAVLEDIMYTEVISAPPDETEDEVVEDIFKYDIPAMPVVDENGGLLGIVTTEDAWDAIEEEVINEKNHPKPLKVVGALAATIVGLTVYTIVLVEIFKMTGLPTL